MPSWESLLTQQDSRKISAFELELARPDGLGGLETKTLRISDRPISPDKTLVYYDPRAKGVPSYRQSIQEVSLGRSQIGFGRLQLLNGDGALDADLAGWSWRGRPVVHKLGFAELDTADFRTVFTGRMGQPQMDNNLVDIPITDNQADLWEAIYPAGTYTGSLETMVGDLLAAAGITSIDATLWAAWAAENPFNCWYKVTSDEGEEVGRVLDKLLAPLACWAGFSREGVFRIGTFKAADAGDPELAITGRELFSWEEKPLARAWKVTAEYWTVTGDSPETGLTDPWSDPDIKDLDPTAAEEERSTLLTALADAEIIRDRWVALLSAQRYKATAELKMQPMLLELHDQVRPTGTRYSADVNYRVVTIEEIRGFGQGKNRMKLEMFR